MSRFGVLSCCLVILAPSFLASGCVSHGAITRLHTPAPPSLAKPSATAASTTAGIPQDGLIADVPFTEQSGTVANDISGNGNACTFSAGPNAPTWNGAGIGFAGDQGHESCVFPAALSASARTVAVCANLPTGVEMSKLNGSSQGSGGGLSYPTLLGATNRSGLTLWLQSPPYGTARLYYQQSMYSGYGSFPTGTNDMSIGWNCFFYEIGSTSDAPATVDHLFRNGVETTSYSRQSASAALAAASGVWYLGGGGFASNMQFVGTIEHVVAWNRLLSATEVSTAWQALQAEMTGRGAVLNPPTSQTTNAVADCLGDSQTAGTVSGATWCSTSLLTLPAVAASNWELNNNAENGTTCISMESGIQAEEALDWSPKAPHSVLMLYCGANDITVGGVPPADLWQRQLAICSLAKQAGYEYVTDTTLPSWIDQDPKVQALDSLIRANWQSCFSSVVDLANDPRLGATGAYANSDYFLQQVPSHMNAAGQAILGGYTTNVLASLYGNTVAHPTVVNASYQETAPDNFVSVHAAPQSVTITLPSCLGYVAGHARSVTNAGTGAVYAIAPAQELINTSSDAITIPAGTTVVFLVQPLDVATSGCTWTTATSRYPAIVLSTAKTLESGQPAVLTASASGNGGIPTGTVTFATGGTILGTASLNSGGTAALTAATGDILPGNYPITAAYSGNSGYIAVTSAAVTLALDQAATATTFSASTTQVSRPASVTLTATVKRISGSALGGPGGKVTFLYAGQPIGHAELNGSGAASLVAASSAVPTGNYAITAEYTGDIYDSASTSVATTVTVQ